MRIMAVDFGFSRTGLAICDKLELLATPICVIEEKNITKLVQKIVDNALINDVEEIVVGYPKNMNGTVGEAAKNAEFLISKLKKNLPNVSFVLWDERNTTKIASILLKDTNTYGKKRKKVIDAVAATIILQSYMDFKKIQKNS